jgi:hypothetical protein
MTNHQLPTLGDIFGSPRASGSGCGQAVLNKAVLNKFEAITIVHVEGFARQK